jgi:hypothetical protein
MSSPTILPSRARPHLPKGLTELLDEVDALTENEDHPSLHSVMGAFGPAGALPVMMLVALVIVSPLSGIPLLSSLGGLTIAGIALQLVLGRDRLWLPGWLSRRSIPRDRLSAALVRLRPAAEFLDRHSRPRLRMMTAPPVSQLVLVLCGLAGLSMPFLEILPFTSSLLAMAVTCLGFSLLTRDGLWAALAMMPIGGAGWLLVTLIG